MIIKKYNRRPNRFLNRVWIGLYANRIQRRPGRRVWKGAKGIMGMWCVQKQPQPLLDLLEAPSVAMAHTTDGVWTWEMPIQNPIPTLNQS